MATKTVKQALLFNLRAAANLVTPDGSGETPIASYDESIRAAAYAELGYRVGRALSLSRKVKGN